MKTHTPGPWRAHGDGYERMRDDGETPARSLNIWAGDGDKIKHIAEVCIPIHQGWKHEETAANCNLIASAPTLLEALKGIVEMESDPVRFMGCRSARYDAARAAIAKAEGREWE